MTKFRIWLTIIASSLLGILGVVIAGVLPLPAPTTIDQSRILYGLLGVLIGFMTFGRVAAWLVKTFTRLMRQATLRIAAEVINQFTQLTSRGLSLRPRGLVDGEGVTEGLAEESLKISGAVILDTSSIIDGRVLDVAKSGFLSGFVLIPDFVLTELQQVADSSDSMKRIRGRHGFETVQNLKKVRGIKVEIWDKALAGKSVDEKLIKLGKIIHGRILTTDFNLNQVAKLSGVQILNMNELANALKHKAVPGENLLIKVSQLGKDKNQGVGYLEDGTMVVVKDGESLMGQEVKIKVDKVIQAPAGRMIFASKI